MNDAVRAWLAWEQHQRDGKEEEAVRAYQVFGERQGKFVSALRAFQQSRNNRIGTEAVTPRKKGGGAAGVSGDNDALVGQVQRLVAVGESLVDMGALVRCASAAPSLHMLTSLGLERCPLPAHRRWQRRHSHRRRPRPHARPRERPLRPLVGRH